MNPVGRRDFLKIVGGGLIGIGCLNLSKKVFADTPPAAGPVSAEDPLAKALGYYEDASKVDIVKYAKRAGAEGQKQFCSSCNLFQTALKKDGRGPCTLFGGKTVNEKGWCSGWVVKAA